VEGRLNSLSLFFRRIEPDPWEALLEWIAQSEAGLGLGHVPIRKAVEVDMEESL
jgi:hypothetical protein